MDNKVYIVIGGQYGSESKGLAVTQIMEEKGIMYTVRTGSINAGHSIPYKGKIYKNQQIPVGWVVEGAKLYIGAGAYVSPEILDREIKMIEEATGESLLGRLFIDKRCSAHLEEHKKIEEEKHLHETMGSTGEGVAEAAITKMRRDGGHVRFADTDYARENNMKHFTIIDTVAELNAIYDNGKDIMLEGTQGALLDLHLGFYPFVTSRQTNAATWLAEAGLSPNVRTEIVMVIRTMPIRVAGNSGPIGSEVEWDMLVEDINRKRHHYDLPPVVKQESIDAFREAVKKVSKEYMGYERLHFSSMHGPEREEHSEFLVNVHKKALESLPEEVIQDLKNFFEMTTVTKKLRRIATLDRDDLAYTIAINRPDYIVLNFLNYLFPTYYEVKDKNMSASLQYEEVMAYISNLEEDLGVPIKYVNYNPLFIVKIKNEEDHAN